MIGPETLPVGYYDRVIGINGRFRNVVMRRHALAKTPDIRNEVYRGALVSFIQATNEMRRENIDAIERMIARALQ